MPQAKGGQDPTRNHPGGSRTETKISEQSELGSDNAGGQDDPGRPARGRGDAGQDPSGLRGNNNRDLTTGHRQTDADEVR